MSGLPAINTTAITNLVPGTPQSNEVNAHATAVAANAQARTQLEQKLIYLKAKKPQTKEDQDEIKRLEALIEANKVSDPDPTKTELVVPAPAAIVNEVSKKEAVEASLKESPVPKNNVEIRYASFDPNDLVSYINATQHLNPWGRMRQCDEDCKNLMTIINRSANHKLGEFKQLLEQIADIVTE